MITLDHLASIFVPSTVDVNSQIDNAEIVNSILTELSSTFGGASAQDVRGAWLSDSAGLVVENVTRIFCYGSDKMELLEKFSSLAERIKVDMSQDSVLFDVDGIGYLV